MARAARAADDHDDDEHDDDDDDDDDDHDDDDHYDHSDHDRDDDHDDDEKWSKVKCLGRKVVENVDCGPKVYETQGNCGRFGSAGPSSGGQILN